MTEAALDPIDGYQPLETLGSGGYATVYKVTKVDGNESEMFALKLLSAEKSQDEAACAQFQKEIDLLSSINSDGIVSVIDTGSHEDRPYFVMSYCDGGTLKRRLYEAWPREMTINEAKELGFAIGRALWPAHAKVPAIVHRDIKPQNLLIRTRSNAHPDRSLKYLQPTEEIVIGDFGLARHVSLQTTNEETVGGFTRGYAPLEQVKGDGNIDASADVYSASAVLISALLDVAPQQVFSEADSAFSDEDFKKCGPLETVLRKGLSSDPKKRQQNIKEWCKELDAAFNEPADRPDGGFDQAIPRDSGSSASQTTEEDTNSNPTLARDGDLDSRLVDESPVSSDTDPEDLDASDGSHDFGDSAELDSGSALERMNRKLASNRLLIGAIGIGLITCLLVFGFSQRDSRTDLIGPSAGVVGDPAVFFLNTEEPARVWKIDGTEVDNLTSSWVVNEATTDSQLLNITPLSPGTYEMEAIASDGGSLVKQTYTVADELPGSVRIIGADHLKVGEEARVRLQGLEAGSEIAWTVADQQLDTFAINFTPQTPGTMTVTARSGDIETTRKFTVLP